MHLDPEIRHPLSVVRIYQPKNLSETMPANVNSIAAGVGRNIFSKVPSRVWKFIYFSECKSGLSASPVTWLHNIKFLWVCKLQRRLYIWDICREIMFYWSRGRHWWNIKREKSSLGNSFHSEAPFERGGVIHFYVDRDSFSPYCILIKTGFNFLVQPSICEHHEKTHIPSLESYLILHGPKQRAIIFISFLSALLKERAI